MVFTPRKGFDVALGTAMWGWSVSKSEAHAILDCFYSAGGRYVDVASNYPINKEPNDFGKATLYLSEWLRSNKCCRLKVIYKVGSESNMGRLDINISEAALFTAKELAEGHLYDSFDTLCIHWDNRTDQAKVEDTALALVNIRSSGVSIGLSGVDSPELYKLIYSQHSIDKFHFQVKENLLVSKARERASLFFPNALYFAYGLNMGGVKEMGSSRGPNSSIVLRGGVNERRANRFDNVFRATSQYSWPVSSIHELTLYHAILNRGLSGAIIGPSKLEQLQGTVKWLQNLSVSTLDFSHYEQIRGVSSVN